jgi:hypothetical protein
MPVLFRYMLFMCNENELWELNSSRQEINELKSILSYATRFELGKDEFGGIVAVEARGKDLWCVSAGGECLTVDGDWIYEPLPSNRTSLFIRKARFSFDEAMRRGWEVVNFALIGQLVESSDSKSEG